MRKLLLSVCIFAMTVVAASAQLLPSFQLGIKGALNFSSLTSDDGSWLSKSNRTGYQAGIYARIGAAGLHFQPELYFTGKGAEAKFEENGNTETAKITFTSLDLPLLLGTRIGLGPLGVRIQAGPVVSFVTNKGIGDAFKSVMDPADYKNQAWAVTGGVGIDFGKLRVDLRYEHGLSDLSKNDSYPQKLKLWNIGIGYQLFSI